MLKDANDLITEQVNGDTVYYFFLLKLTFDCRTAKMKNEYIFYLLWGLSLGSTRGLRFRGLLLDFLNNFSAGFDKHDGVRLVPDEDR